MRAGSGHSFQIGLRPRQFQAGPKTDNENMETVGESGGLFGLYELSDNGTILYSRPRGVDGLHQSTPETVGRDFFYDIIDRENREDLRRHFRRFLRNRRSFDAFFYYYRLEREVVPTKIYFTRASETDDDRPKEIVIMDIRQAGQ